MSSFPFADEFRCPDELSFSTTREGLEAGNGAPTSLRAFIQRLVQTHRLEWVHEPVQWRFELGRIARQSRSPLLFDNIEGYPGQRVFTNGLRNVSLIGLALGIDPEGSRDDLIAQIRQRAANPVRPVILETAPVVRKTLPDECVDLAALPVPHWHESDCGRYLGTWHINVTKDLETGIRNVGVYRMMLLGGNRATVSTAPGSHLAQHVAGAEKTNQPLPMAVAIGASEAVMMAAAAACPFGFDEYALAGGLQQAAVQLIRCQTLNVEVPADSEIVVEGFIHPHARVQDGPYFDYTGTTNTNPNAFLFEATRITSRENPVFRGASIGVAGAEDHQLFAVLMELKLLDFHRSGVKKHIQDMVLQQRLRRWTGTDGDGEKTARREERNLTS